MTPDLMDDPADVLPSAGKTGVLVIPGHDTGHAKYEWDKDDPADVEEARKTFDAKRKLGWTAYRIDPKTGDKGEVVKTFDPTAERIIMVPAFSGG